MRLFVWVAVCVALLVVFFSYFLLSLFSCPLSFNFLLIVHFLILSLLVLSFIFLSIYFHFFIFLSLFLFSYPSSSHIFLIFHIPILIPILLSFILYFLSSSIYPSFFILSSFISPSLFLFPFHHFILHNFLFSVSQFLSFDTCSLSLSPKSPNRGNASPERPENFIHIWLEQIYRREARSRGERGVKGGEEREKTERGKGGERERER